MAAVVVDIGADTSAFQKEVSRMLGVVQGAGKSIQGILGGIGFAYLGKQALDTVTGLDRMNRAMTTLEGGAEAASKRLAQFREDAKLPGVDFRQAVQADIRLRAAGISAETSRNAIIEFGNALSLAGAEAGQLDNVTLALSQIVSRGQVTADNINQIANAVPQIRAVMKDVFGSADTETLQKMNLDAMTFVEGLIVGFRDLDRASAGLDENLADLGTTMAETVNAVAGPIVNEIIPAMTKLGEVANQNRDAFAALGGAMAGMIQTGSSKAVLFAETLGGLMSDAKLLYDTISSGGSVQDFVDLSRSARDEMSRQKAAGAVVESPAATAPSSGGSFAFGGAGLFSRTISSFSGAFAQFAGPVLAAMRQQLVDNASALRSRASDFARGAFGGLRGDNDTSFGRGSSINPLTSGAGSAIQAMTRQANLLQKQADKMDKSNSLLGDIKDAVKNLNLTPVYK